MLLLGVKTPNLGEREALKTIRHGCTRQNLSIDAFFVKIGGGQFLVKILLFCPVKVPPKIAVFGEPLTPYGSSRIFSPSFCAIHLIASFEPITMTLGQAVRSRHPF